MSYDSSNKVISAPVSVEDAKQCVPVTLSRTVSGSPQTKQSSDVGALCGAVVGQTIPATDANGPWTVARERINKWAKYKPVRLAEIDTTSQLKADKTWKTPSELPAGVTPWWKGTSGNCGITFAAFGDIETSLKAAIDNKTTIWGYENANQFFRLIDFNEYHHEALPPTYAVSASTAQLKAGSTLKIMVATSIDDGYSVRFSDIGSFNNYYHTAAIFDGSGNLKLIHSAPKTVGQYGDGETIEIEIPWNNGTYGYDGILQENQTYYAYVFISSASYTCQTSEYVGDYTYIPMPCGEADYGMQPASFLCKADVKWATITSFCNSGERLVNWTLDMYGNGNQVQGVLRLIDLQGNIVVTGQVQQVINLNFSNGEQTMNGITVTTTVGSVTAGDGTTGYEMTNDNDPRVTLTLPTDNPEMYLVEFVCVGVDTVRAGIGHDINPNV